MSNSFASKTYSLQKRLRVVCLFSLLAFIVCALHSWLPLVLRSEPLTDTNNLSVAGLVNVAGFFISMQFLYGAVRQGYRSVNIQAQGLQTTPNPLLGYLVSLVFFLLAANLQVVLGFSSQVVLVAVFQGLLLISAVSASILGSRQS